MPHQFADQRASRVNRAPSLHHVVVPAERNMNLVAQVYGFILFEHDLQIIDWNSAAAVIHYGSVFLLRHLYICFTTKVASITPIARQKVHTI